MTWAASWPWTTSAPGYASFRYLRLFPIDLVKIDGEYVVDLVRNPEDQVLVRALVQVCQAYGIHTVAEFVQDERDPADAARVRRRLRPGLPDRPPVPGGGVAAGHPAAAFKPAVTGYRAVMEHFTIATVAEKNPDFRRVLWTGSTPSS